MGKRHVTGALTLGFTILSLYAGWRFYSIILGVGFAWMIVICLESARLTTLYYAIWKSIWWIFGFYAAVAISCAGVAVAFFVVQVQTQKEIDLQKFAKPIATVRRAANAKMQIDLQNLQNGEAGQGYYKMRLAYWQSVGNIKKMDYHETRISQISDTIEATRARYMTIITASPDNPKIWIEANAALLNLDIEIKAESMDIVEKSLMELVGWSLPTIKKISGIVLVSVIELLIILLAILTYQNGKERKKKSHVLKTLAKAFAKFTNHKQVLQTDLQNESAVLQNGKSSVCPICKKTFYRQEIGNHKSRGKCANIMREQNQKEGRNDNKKNQVD